MSANNELNLRKLNLRHFCRDLLTHEASVSLSAMPRLRETLFNATGDTRFAVRLAGEQTHGHHGAKEDLLTLTVSGHVPLQCQRCLEEVSVPVDSTASFILVNNESEADAMDESTRDDDEAPEPLVASKSADLIALAEDEILLSLPLVPMHEQCPAPLRANDAPDESDNDAPEAADKKPKPFAALAALKTGKSS